MYKLPLVYVVVACLVSCSSANNKPVLIKFSPDSTAIVFSDIDAAGLLELKNTPGIDSVFSDVISVTEIPAENDSVSMEKPISGKLNVLDRAIVFKPGEQFIRGKRYAVSAYLNTKFGNGSMLVRGKLNGRVQPVRVILER